MDTLQAGVRERGAHGQRGVSAHGALHSPQLCLTWESVLVDAGKDFISVGHSAEEQTLHHNHRPYLSLLSIRHLDCLFIRLFTGSLLNVRHYCLLTALLGAMLHHARRLTPTSRLSETSREPNASLPFWTWQLLGSCCWAFQTPSHTENPVARALACPGKVGRVQISPFVLSWGWGLNIWGRTLYWILQLIFEWQVPSS